MVLLCSRHSLTPSGTRSPTSRSLPAPPTVTHPSAGLGASCLLRRASLLPSGPPGPDPLGRLAAVGKKGPVVFNPTKYMKDRDCRADSRRTQTFVWLTAAGAPLALGWLRRSPPAPFTCLRLPHLPLCSPRLFPYPHAPHLSLPPRGSPRPPAQLRSQQQEAFGPHKGKTRASPDAAPVQGPRGRAGWREQTCGRACGSHGRWHLVAFLPPRGLPLPQLGPRKSVATTKTPVDGVPLSHEEDSRFCDEARV